MMEVVRRRSGWVVRIRRREKIRVISSCSRASGLAPWPVTRRGRSILVWDKKSATNLA